ncbi:MAG: rod shape-determining protein RodA [Alphaproteobacteria bacterium]|nr:rod shape-determining protein RodA [Alphaproteobacteria bacterium]
MKETMGLGETELTLGRKIALLNWAIVLLVVMLAAIGCAMLFSAAGGSWDPWAARQAIRFGVGITGMIIVALMDIRFIMRWAYLAYFGALALLIGVELAGEVGGGAQRWIDLKVFKLQPSEVMKVAVVLGLARYFHGLTHEDTGRIVYLLPPILMVLAPMALVLRQPDLGTALILGMIGASILFVAGVRLWKFALVGMAGLAALPIAWSFLRDYQKARIMTFVNPESDPLGAGYHILQSKIALGSGGVFGKGFMNGSQAHLDFLPEKQTDFIFTMLAEEFGMAGAVGLLALFLMVLAYGLFVALQSRNQFGRLLAFGLTINLFLYLFINVAMVTGLIPVVGVPLPLISYGGTAMLTVLLGIGLVLGADIHRDFKIGRRGPEED